MRLGVNVDHVGTVRNARGTDYPDPIVVALLAEKAGADNITCHLREDRRHIRDEDVFALKQRISCPLNLEMAVTDEMLAIAVRVKPHSATLVPEGRQELTTESGLHIFDQRLSEAVNTILRQKIAPVLFIDPDVKAVRQAKQSGCAAVEFHLGDVCEQLDRGDNPSQVIARLHEPFALAHSLGLGVHIGHGINYKNAHYFQPLPHVAEANIGHAIIAEAINVGIAKAVRRMKRLLLVGRH
ncbi:MAG: pyridoxine 5'-phosphate synthase [Pseudomonadota bacterium]|nr:pyridoxine 5'-phosphate synthase [Pseudomonadota bacterium]